MVNVFKKIGCGTHTLFIIELLFVIPGKASDLSNLKRS